MYNFRRRLTEHMRETGENLLEQVFEQVTDEQIKALELKTDKLRMDSTLVSSNIRQMSRLQLLVEVLQRVWRMLNVDEQQHYETDFETYTRGTSGQYTYHVAPDEISTRLEGIGYLMRRLVDELADSHSDNATYQVLTRVYGEHFAEEQAQIRLKTGQELRADSLQSPDDAEATYRKKRGEGHQGYVTNVTETCNPDNDVQLVVKVQTESNNTDDAAMLNEAVPNLVERTDVNEMNTDGGYNSADVDETLNEHQIEQIQTAIRGGKSADDRLGVSDFVLPATKMARHKRCDVPANRRLRSCPPARRDASPLVSTPMPARTVRSWTCVPPSRSNASRSTAFCASISSRSMSPIDTKIGVKPKPAGRICARQWKPPFALLNIPLVTVSFRCAVDDE